MLGVIPATRTNRDAVGLRALLTVRYERFDAISENRWRWRDTSRVRALFGCQPTGRAEEYLLDN
jgi:hypothetical protein